MRLLPPTPPHSVPSSLYLAGNGTVRPGDTTFRVSFAVRNKLRALGTEALRGNTYAVVVAGEAVSDGVGRRGIV